MKNELSLGEEIYSREEIIIPLSYDTLLDTSVKYLIYEKNKTISELSEEIDNLKYRIDKLESTIYLLDVNDDEAKKKLLPILKYNRSLGRNDVYIFELVQETRLPADQIERILDSLRK